ncbi:MAG TPA: TonB family protein [Thermoanaerobaculia bacterium]
MFDTSIVRARAIAAPRRTTLLVSVLIHSLAIVGAVSLTVASTQQPKQPPRQLELYRAAEVPTVPPPPLGVRPHATPPHASPPAVPRQPAAPRLITAPETIPENTVTTGPDAIAATGPVGSSTDPAGDGPLGDPNGVPGGVGTGETSTGPAVAPYTPGVGGVTSARVIRRVEPRFPQSLVHAVRYAIVVVRCVIDKNGDISDPEIVTSSYPPFNEAVLSALRQWKFAPGSMHGQAVDTYFELTVRFEVK